mmetsp:Transcript_11829/g.24981  ORF Transcript_11829/g.24981 Transcript_11829/m.24981 type:complete len:516 (+) Transcript_11829:156-1703(+)
MHATRLSPKRAKGLRRLSADADDARLHSHLLRHLLNHVATLGRAHDRRDLPIRPDLDGRGHGVRAASASPCAESVVVLADARYVGEHADGVLAGSNGGAGHRLHALFIRAQVLHNTLVGAPEEREVCLVVQGGGVEVRVEDHKHLVVRALHRHRDGKATDLGPLVLLDHRGALTPARACDTASGQPDERQLAIVVIQAADAGLPVGRRDCCLDLVEVRPGRAIVYQGHHRRALHTLLQGTNGLKSIALRVQRNVVAEDREPATGELIAPHCRVLNCADDEDLLILVDRRDDLQARHVVPAASLHRRHLVAAPRSHLPARDDDGRELARLVVLAQVHAALHRTVDRVLELELSLLGLVEPGHQYVVNAVELMGPVRELRPHIVAAPLEGPAHPILVVGGGSRNVGDEEDLVVLLAGLHHSLQATHRRETLGRQSRDVGLVGHRGGIAHLPESHREVRHGQVALIVLRRELRDDALLRQVLRGLHVLTNSMASAYIAMPARTTRAGTSQASTLDLAP